MRLLVIEDEQDLQRVIGKCFREANFSVDSASDGSTGLRMALEGEYDAIVLDLMLPGIDGSTVLSKLRAAGRKTAVLILTARDAIKDRIDGLNSGADDYLTKPFSLEELVARVRALIRRSAGQPSPVVQLGDVEIDTAGASVRKSGQLVPLAGKEYALLELLIINRGKLVTRSMIYDHIYGAQDDSFSNVVDVYVSNLRRKLGPDLIQTMRGRGYTIRA
jgi:two-component system, OmpR family, response regulator